MGTLKIENFFSSDNDLEINQYKVMGGLKEYRNEFNKKKIYPALSELITLAFTLEEILKNKKKMKNGFPKQIAGYDIENKKIIFEGMENIPAKVEMLFDLIEWALPVIKSTIEEAIILYDFVEKNIEVDNVGLLPIYKDEGYFIVPNNKDFRIEVYRFECSLFTKDSEKFRTLKTKLVEELNNKLINKTPGTIKLDLINKFKELPNPATFFCETDLDFPFTETIFPVAKRKLMTKVAA
jgi:hypothetical protein